MSQVPDAAATVDNAVGTDDLPVDLDPRFDGLSEAELEEIHEKAMKRWRAAEQAWKNAHDAYTADQKFANGEQWDETVAAARTKANLSVLVYNQLPSKHKYIVNNGRRGIKATKVYPVSGGATKNTAKIYDGLILSIKNRSNAKSAFLHALSCAAIGGLGAYRYMPIENEDGDPDIEIQRILDPTSVFYDPAAIKQDFSDAEYVFVKTWVPKDVFEAENGEDAEGLSNDKQTSDMFTAESVLVLEYWCRNRETKRVEQYVMNGSRVLRVKRNYMGKYLPIVLVVGEEKHIDGKREYKGIVRDVKDMQVLLNLSKSKTADYLGRSGSQTWLVEEAQIEGYEEIWLSPNVSGAAVLPYKATSAGKPERLDAPPPPVGFQQISTEADADIRNAIGIRDPLEKLPANVATKTIEMQISQSNIGTLEFMDHLNDAVLFGDRGLVDLIPRYINYAHVREIMSPDGQVRTVTLNAPFTDDSGQEVMHMLAEGRYSVTSTDGPSYESMRSEAVDNLKELAKADPRLMQLAGDVVLRNMDFDGAQEVADRYRATVPPEILAASSSSDADGSGPNQAQLAQNQLMQAQQEIQRLQMESQQLHEFLKQAQQEKATKEAEIKAKTDSELQLEQVKHANAMELERLKQSGAMGRDVLKGHTEVFKAEMQHNSAHETTADNVPVSDPDPALALAQEIGDAVAIPSAFAPNPTQEIA